MKNLLERIELRIGGEDKEKVLGELRNLVANVSEQAGPLKIKIFTHQSISSDFSILLYRSDDNTGDLESELGIFLVSELKQYGLVNYNVWIEDK